MKSPLNLIISREYLQRVRRKSFIITTLLVPILMIGLMVAPALVAMLSTPEAKTIAVIDDTGAIFNRLNDSNEITFESYTQPLDSARANADVEAILSENGFEDIRSFPDTQGIPRVVSGTLNE